MTHLFQNPDGANRQARAVLAYLSGHDGLECSWSHSNRKYMAEPQVNRWHNCREQGYVVSMQSQDYTRQLNIIFYEHRNSDEICAVEWEQKTLNPPTIQDAEFGNVFKDKYDVSHRVECGHAYEMAEWIYERMERFWKETAFKNENAA